MLQLPQPPVYSRFSFLLLLNHNFPRGYCLSLSPSCFKYLKSLPTSEGDKDCIQLQAFSSYTSSQKLLEDEFFFWIFVFNPRIQNANLESTEGFFWKPEMKDLAAINCLYLFRMKLHKFRPVKVYISNIYGIILTTVSPRSFFVQCLKCAKKRISRERSLWLVWAGSAVTAILALKTFSMSILLIWHKKWS